MIGKAVTARTFPRGVLPFVLVLCGYLVLAFCSAQAGRLRWESGGESNSSGGSAASGFYARDALTGRPRDGS